MKKLMLFMAISLMVSCDSKETRKKEIFNKKELLLDKIEDNSIERAKKQTRLEFIGLELQALNNGLNELSLQDRKNRASELKKEIQESIIWNENSKKQDSVNFVKIDKLEQEYNSLK